MEKVIASDLFMLDKNYDFIQSGIEFRLEADWVGIYLILFDDNTSCKID